MRDFHIMADNGSRKNLNAVMLFVICVLLSAVCTGCTGMAASAEEYYAIGMAFFDLGRFEDAERWLIRARQANRTMVASTYNLGRLAFERQRYDEAAGYFENILRTDPDNVIALRAAAFTRIRTGEIDIAQRHYSRLLYLIPESADDGYNHALVLHAMGLYSEAEEVLERYPFALIDNKDVHLLYARTLAALNKVEAIDSFASWLAVNSNAKARFEYAQTLERHDFFARALEEYRLALTEAAAASVDPRRIDVQFAISRVLLIADGGSSEGITELQSAVTNGFNNIEAIEGLLANDSISAANRESIQSVINNLRQTAAAAAAAVAAAAAAQEEQENNRTEEESGAAVSDTEKSEDGAD